MKREELERTFCWKISGELKLFKYRMLQKEKEEIYTLAYQIDCIINIYEILVKLCEEMTAEELETCMFVPELLAHLYWRWIKTPDSQNEELEQAVRKTIRETQERAA